MCCSVYIVNIRIRVLETLLNNENLLYINDYICVINNNCKHH